MIVLEVAVEADGDDFGFVSIRATGELEWVPLGRIDLRRFWPRLPEPYDGQRLPFAHALDCLRRFRIQDSGEFVDALALVSEEPAPFLFRPYIRMGKSSVVFGDGGFR